MNALGKNERAWGMKAKRKFVGRVALAAVLMVGFAPAVFADMVPFELDTVFSGPGNPSGSIFATFDTAGAAAGNVLLTLDATSLTGANEKIKEWYFNFDPGKDPDELEFSYNGGTQTAPANTVLTEANFHKADGDGFYDILFQFPTSAGDRFGAGDTSVWEIHWTGGALSPSDFSFDSVGSADPYLTAAHILGSGANQESSWVTVPAPGATALGLIGLGFVGRVKRRIA